MMKPDRFCATLTVYEQMLLGTKTPTSNSAARERGEAIKTWATHPYSHLLTFRYKGVGTGKDVWRGHILVRVERERNGSVQGDAPPRRHWSAESARERRINQVGRI